MIKILPKLGVPFKARYSGSQKFSSDTIYALSSGGLTKAGVAVVRISGPGTKHCIKALIKLNCDSNFIKPRLATLRSIFDPTTGEQLDKGLVLWFPGPASFTGEDSAEFHLHGSKAVIGGVFEALSKLDKPSLDMPVRPAEPGEFTRRAFENGKMDLTEVEGLADLLESDTIQQRRQALLQLEGHLRVRYENWRKVLMKCLAHTEAVIDFGDDDREDDVDDTAMEALHPQIIQLRNELEFHLNDHRKGEIIREGVQIALVGPPNAGKSSLINALARRPAAIVSPIAGTTRDVVEVRLDIGGFPCNVRDTAGLRDEGSTNDEIEIEGMKRARQALVEAHIQLLVVDSSDPLSMQNAIKLQKQMVAENTDGQRRLMVIYNKQDLSSATASILNRELDVPCFHVSCTTGAGLPGLEDALRSSVVALLQSDQDPSNSTSSGTVMITRDRHRRHVQNCVIHLDRFLNRSLPMDAAAEELRLAMLELSKVTGRVDVEELLDIIFRDFCIGK